MLESFLRAACIWGRWVNLHLGKMSGALAEDFCHERPILHDASDPAVLVDSRRPGELFQQRRAVTRSTAVATRQGSQELGETRGVQCGLPGGVPESVRDGAEVLPIFDEVGDGAFPCGRRQAFPDGDILTGKVPGAVPDIEPLALPPCRRGELAPSGPEVSDAVEPGSGFPGDDDPRAVVVEAFESEPAGFGREPRCPEFLVLRARGAGAAVDTVDEPDQMAVIVRSTAQAQAVARDLRRRGVPLASRTPAVLLRTEPAARALTEVVRAALDGDLGQDGQPPLPEAVQRLLTGPLIGLSPLDLRRLRRRIRVWAEGPASRLGEQAASAQAQGAQAQGAQVEGAQTQGTQAQARGAQTEGARSGGRRGERGPAGRVTLPGLVGDLESARQLVEDLGRESVAAQAADLLRAAQVVSALREVLGLGSPPADGARGPEAGGRSPGGELPDDVAARHPGAPGQADGQRPDPTGGPSDASARGDRGRAPRDVEALLWAAWDASGRAEAWRALALEEGGGRGLLAEAAEHHLDVVTALFKRAEVWSERYPGVDGAVFLAELDSELVPSDSVAPQGRRPAGVAVLTPAAAAGEQWEVVVVMGLERDVWPDLRLRDSLTRSGLLVDAVTGRLPLRPDGSLDPGADPASARAQVRGDERRMLVAAMSRASRRLVLTATSDVEHAPSSFLLEVAASAGLPVTDVDGAPLTSPDAGDLTLRGLVGELRQAAVRGALDSATPAERARGTAAVTLLADLARRGVPGASPTTWLDVAGPTSTSPLTALDQRVRVSPSDVESLSTCPLRWFLSRHGGDRPASGAQHLGSLVHALAEQAEREHLRGPALRARAEELLPGLGYPQTWLGQVQQRRVREMVGRLDAYLADCDALGVTAQVELPVRADTVLAPGDLSEDLGGYLEDLLALTGAGAGLRLRIAGRVDRLERRADGSVRVIDLKTGRLVPSSPERHPQLATYRLALEALGRVVGGGALVLLGKEPGRRSGEGYVLAPAGGALDPSPVQDPDTGESLPWAQDLLAAAALGSLGPLYEARSGEHCRNCAVKDSCPVRSEGKRVTQ